LSLPKVVNGGIIAGHDYLGYESVQNAVDLFCMSFGFELHIVPDEEPAMASFWFRKP
jgi:hypothetical protein